MARFTALVAAYSTFRSFWKIPVACEAGSNPGEQAGNDQADSDQEDQSEDEDGAGLVVCVRGVPSRAPSAGMRSGTGAARQTPTAVARRHGGRRVLTRSHCWSQT